MVYFLCRPSPEFKIDEQVREKGTHTTLWLCAQECTGKNAKVHWRRDTLEIVELALAAAAAQDQRGKDKDMDKEEEEEEEGSRTEKS